MQMVSPQSTSSVTRITPPATLPTAFPGTPSSAAGPAGTTLPAILAGTLPVLPFADRFYGTIHADGQRPRVAALACTSDGAVAVLSLVGYDTSVAAALARLYKKEMLTLDLDEEGVWNGPTTLHRPECGLRQAMAALLGTRERHYVAFARTADIGEGMLNPPAIPPQLGSQQEDGPEPEPAHTSHHRIQGTQDAQKTQGEAPSAPRVLLGNWNEATPAPGAVLGHLRALRIIHLPHWASALWEHGLQGDLIVELPALGIRAWQLTDDLARWSALVTDGVRSGWLTDEKGTRWTSPALAMSAPPQEAPPVIADPSQEEQPAA